MSPASCVLFGAVVAFAVLCLCVWKIWERGEIERKFSAATSSRQKEIADHEAWLRTAGRGPHLVPSHQLTEEQLIQRAKRRDRT
jgi:hypothetical protein